MFLLLTVMFLWFGLAVAFVFQMSSGYDAMLAGITNIPGGVGEVFLPLTNTGGTATGSLAVPAIAALAGSTVYLQGMAGDPVTGLVFSDAGAATLGLK